MRILAAFLGGAIAGAGLALLFAPEKGEELRSQVRNILRRYGVLDSPTEDEIVEQIVAEVTAARG
ncbi:MAG: YtxH domain-containing protein [Clostridium sp.]|nr:YtxH domain-containing protein [Clostridium sp.]